MLSEPAQTAVLQMTKQGPVGPRLDIDLEAVRRNFRRVRALAPGAEPWPVVKANAYGIGAREVVRTLTRDGARAFFTATLAEAEALKDVAQGAPLYLLNGLPAGAARDVALAGARPVINSRAQLREWLTVAKDRPCALQLDTGINRTGMPQAEFEAAMAAGEISALKLDLFMSHLACADEQAHPMNEAQLARFLSQAARLPSVRLSLSASAGATLAPRFHLDVTRPGVGLYGGNPLSGAPNPFEPVLRLSAPILQLRDIKPGETVGYGGTFTAQRPTRIATIAIGYADGVPRALSNKGEAFVSGARVAYAGRVSMDLITLDVTDVPSCAVGDTVELLNHQYTVDDMAAAAGTPPYEILNRLGWRYQRAWHGGDAP